MHKSSSVIITALILLTGCGASKVEGNPSSASESSGSELSGNTRTIVKDSEIHMAKWRDEDHTNMLLRNLAFDYIKTVRSGNFEAIRDEYLTNDGLNRTISKCQNDNEIEALKSCVIFPEGSVLVEKIETIDDTHAKIIFSLLLEDGEQINPAFELPVLLTIDGPKFEFGRFENE